MTKRALFRKTVLLAIELVFLFQSPESFLSDRPQALLPVCDQAKCGYINSGGEIVIPLTFDETGRFAEGFAPVRIGSSWGYVDEKGRLVIRPQFSGARGYSGGLAAVRIGLKWGYIDTTAKVSIQGLFDDAESFSYGFARVRVGSDWHYIDVTGKEAAVRFWGRPSFSDGLAPVALAGRIGYVDSRLRTVIQPRFDDADQFVEGRAAVLVRGNWGYIDRSGATVIEPRFKRAALFSGGLAAVETQTGKVGYIDTVGNMIIPARFLHAFSFSEGRAAVVYEGRYVRTPREHTGLRLVGSKWGFINEAGELVIKLASSVDYAEPFEGGLSLIRLKDGKEGYIDRVGNYIWKPSE